MERPRCVQGPRAARRSEWLRSALAHHHRPDPGAENEIVVLATGIDQYLQEVFHHLAHPNQEEAVSAADFGALCALLGLPEEEEDGEFTELRSDLPPQLSFRQFHSRLCGYFRARSSGDGRLPLTEDTELVERQIRARWPRVRRRKCVTFDLERQPNSCQSSSGRTPKDSGDSEEVSALRELVEDLRSALQGSDARCLALEVALRRDRAPAPPPPPLPTVASPTSITFAQGKLVPTSRIKGGEVARRLGRRRDARDPLVRELKLIRSSRDGQLKEAIRFNQRLEEEVGWAYQEVRKLQALESALRRENTLIRRRAEEAREALSLGLQRVQLLQEQAQLVPQLQSRITQLETEVQQHRSCCICSHNPLVLDTREEELSSKSDGECLQRAVEGRAASDEEEEEERGARDDAEVKTLDCSQGTLTRQNHSAQLGSQTEGDSRGHCRWGSPAAPPPVSSAGSGELWPQAQEDRARVRTHLSAVEEQFRDALTLLLQLRNKVSCLQMDRLVVDVCRRSGDCPTLVLRVAESLCLHLTSDHRVGERQEKGVGASSSGRQPGSVRALITSC
ncbi:EF-hand and coiled-coil domain-containing protein 1 [Synchiropus splendidus]|uniref:EF-hand and coiled-coil domain-containing protein 1 n=1 Tax=Synchiropus splendidus TaxID=270530 RepID=UPI00237EAC54|nr:EF-hand and coiled-coil domain-containing protein 1 [Synchiropus splendidus]